jgi:type VI secretion system protein ImpK
MQDDDKTIIIYPGSDADTGTQVNSTFSTPPTFKSNDVLPPERHHYDIPFLNTQQSQPFLTALRALYREVYQLEMGEKQTDIQTLKRRMIQIMDQHTRSLAEQGYENTHIMIVRYILSTFTDELLGTMDWANGEAWANHSLLGHYYKETYGGEKFFELLKQFVQEPAKYMQHMKLSYACLSLGYKGRYSLSDNADVQVEGIRQELYARIKNYDTQEEKFYQDHPASTKKHKLTLHIPYKLFIIGGLLIMAIIYGIFTSMVTQNEEDLLQILKQEPVVKQTKDHNGNN